MNRQSITRFKRSSQGKARAKQPKAAKVRKSNKIDYKGTTFDSETEFRYYRHLEFLPGVKEIEIQPFFVLVDPYEVECKKCAGRGIFHNPKTNRENKCARCKGGKLTKAGAGYTADFRVTYIDGFVEVIDVKGGPVERDFGLRKSLFESRNGIELIVVRWDYEKGNWKRS